MNVKHALLVTAVVAVFGMGVYLFIQVRSSPATATQVTSREPTRTETPSTPITEPPAAETPAPRKPDGTRTVWERPNIPAMQPSGDTPPAGGDDRKVNLKLDNMMELANKSYDAQEFDQAIAIAGKVLDKDPGNVRMLRILVSSNCILGDAAAAQQNYERLPRGADREQMKTRCERYQVTLKDES